MHSYSECYYNVVPSQIASFIEPTVANRVPTRHALGQRGMLSEGIDVILWNSIPIILSIEISTPQCFTCRKHTKKVDTREMAPSFSYMVIFYLLFSLLLLLYLLDSQHWLHVLLVMTDDCKLLLLLTAIFYLSLHW